MERFQQPIANEVTGVPLAGIKFYVQNYPSGTAAVIYGVNDNTSTPLVQPLTTQADGTFPFYAANGRYKIVSSPPGGQPIIADFLLEDLLFYDIAQFFIGKPTSSQVVLSLPMIHNFTFKVNMLSSRAAALVAATASTTFDIAKNGVNFGTMVFAGGSTAATFVAATPPAFTPGDILSVTAPASADATLSGIGITLGGQVNI